MALTITTFVVATVAVAGVGPRLARVAEAIATRLAIADIALRRGTRSSRVPTVALLVV